MTVPKSREGKSVPDSKGGKRWQPRPPEDVTAEAFHPSFWLLEVMKPQCFLGFPGLRQCRPTSRTLESSLCSRHIFGNIMNLFHI